MRAPLSWIKELVEIPASVTPEQISDGLIRVGFEVEEIIKQGADLTGPLVFAKVLSIEELTDFKKPVRYVGLDCGEKETRFVICGATNLRRLLVICGTTVHNNKKKSELLCFTKSINQDQKGPN